MHHIIWKKIKFTYFGNNISQQRYILLIYNFHRIDKYSLFKLTKKSFRLQNIFLDTNEPPNWIIKSGGLLLPRIPPKLINSICFIGAVIFTIFIIILLFNCIQKYNTINYNPILSILLIPYTFLKSYKTVY